MNTFVQQLLNTITTYYSTAVAVGLSLGTYRDYFSSPRRVRGRFTMLYISVLFTTIMSIIALYIPIAFLFLSHFYFISIAHSRFLIVGLLMAMLLRNFSIWIRPFSRLFSINSTSQFIKNKVFFYTFSFIQFQMPQRSISVT